jgi:hypothetical protein
MGKEIILGAERPLIGYQDERREIHLKREAEYTIPLESPTIELICGGCEEPLVVFYEISTPTKVDCPTCHHENNLMKCINCEAEWQKGDQGFMSIDVGYGSTVHDGLFVGPAYACSANCLVEAFKNDDFDAKGMFSDMIVEMVERQFEPVTELVDKLFRLAKEYFGSDTSKIQELERMARTATDKLPRVGTLSDEMLNDAYLEPFEYVLESFPPNLEDDDAWRMHADIFNVYMYVLKRLLPEEDGQ